jgi:2-aminoadipate transaminase
MISDLNSVLSNSAKNMKKSVIRELLKLTQKKGLISFAGGLPAPTSFPIDDLKEIVIEVLEKEGASALQYSTTEGDIGLREQLVQRYRQNGLDITTDNLIITTASQQGIDLISRIFINPGDAIVCGLPSYLGGLQAFASYGAITKGICFDKFGWKMDELKKTLKELKKEGKKPKFLYLIPDFQNPSGITMPEQRRRDIIALSHEYDVLMVEDSPYREIRFEGEPQRMMYDLDGTESVITLGTFSKTFVPGFRIGWVIAHPDIIDKIVTAKQSADLCTPIFVQRIAARYLEKGLFEKNIKKIVKDYREKRDVMLQGFREFMPKGVTWTEPEGGLFLFLTLPEYMDAEKLFLKAVEKNVAFVIGAAFYCNDCGHNTMRINFSYTSKEENREGVKRLAEVIREEMKH